MDKKESITDRQGYEDLANAVVIMAVRDYRRAYKRYGRGVAYALGRVREIENFFNSRWGNLLCYGCAKEILARVQGELGGAIVEQKVLPPLIKEKTCFTCKYLTLCPSRRKLLMRRTKDICGDWKERV